MAKKKEIKPISTATAVIFAFVAFALMSAFVVYMLSSGNQGGSSTDLSVDQSFVDDSSLEPPPESVEVKETMADAEVGDGVIFGKYEQNGNTAVKKYCQQAYDKHFRSEYLYGKCLQSYTQITVLTERFAKKNPSGCHIGGTLDHHAVVMRINAQRCKKTEPDNGKNKYR